MDCKRDSFLNWSLWGKLQACAGASEHKHEKVKSTSVSMCIKDTVGGLTRRMIQQFHVNACLKRVIVFAANPRCPQRRALHRLTPRVTIIYEGICTGTI